MLLRTQAFLLAASITAALGLLLFAGSPLGQSMQAQGAPDGSQKASENLSPADSSQRSYRIDHYIETSASGVPRGENIYYHKCWVCHNQYQKSAPGLENLFKHSDLMSGSPVAVESVTAKVREGGGGMPSFGTTLSVAEIADLVAYLQDPRCCFEGEELPANPDYRAAVQKWPVPQGLSGGATGRVRLGDTATPEGVLVQLIAPNGVRTTVSSDADGRFEFPKMQAGTYTLRLTSPLEFKSYTRNSVQISGAMKLEDIVLEKISDSSGALPPTPEIISQLSGAELLWNLPGTSKEKQNFVRGCGVGCHSFQQILRNRYDERSWRTLVSRMLHRGGGPIINPPAPGADRTTPEDDSAIAKWLASARGPESAYGPLLPFPRASGASTRAVVTEFELPHVFLGVHDVYGDSKGNIWYTSHMTQYLGRLDPRSGMVTEYKTPLTPGALPGTHHLVIDKTGDLFFSENWAKKLLKFDARTEKFSEVPVDSSSRLNSGGFGNFAMTPDGFVWVATGASAQKIDPTTGKVVRSYPFKGHGSYDSLISDDGNFWAGGSPLDYDANTVELLNIRTGEMLNLNGGTRLSAAKRGAFDPFGNAWFGGMNGTLVELDAKAKRVREFWPPTPYAPYTDFYTASADKNGEVWTGELHGRRYMRFNPKNGQWLGYVMPEPFADDRGGTWIDNSTNPVTVWYADFSLGRIIRIQPMD